MRDGASSLDGLAECVLSRVPRSLSAAASHCAVDATYVMYRKPSSSLLLIYRAHKSGSRRQDLVDEDEDGLLRSELDPLPNNVDELAYGEILEIAQGSR